MPSNLGCERLEHLLGVGVRLDPQHRLCHPSVLVDHERRALDAPVLLPAEALLFPDAVTLCDLVLGIGEERERQPVLLLELDV
jgi:hypothetical protein